MSRARLLFAFLLLAFAALPARAQYVYGVTDLQLDTELDHAYGYSATALDYNACYYYDAAVAGYLFEGTSVADQGYYHGICVAEVFTESPAQENVNYFLYSEHSIIAYYYYSYYGGWYDPWGFFGFSSGGDYGGGFNHFGCYCPTFFAQSTQNLGYTYENGFNPGPADPEIDGPGSVTRGTQATYTLKNAPQTGTIVVHWKFSDGKYPPVAFTGGLTWKGTMVTGGTISATVTRNGEALPTPAPKVVTVNERTGWKFTAAAVNKFANGQFQCVDWQMSVPEFPRKPMTQAEINETDKRKKVNNLGFYCESDGYSSYGYDRVSEGPNANYFYVTRAPSNTTRAGWVLSPQLEDPQSELYRAQCGRDGFISAEQLKINITGHESGAKSHHSHYVAAQNDKDNNVGLGFELVVGPPSDSDTAFQKRVADEAKARSQRISDATEVEPCGDSSASLDQACVDRGFINLAPYRPCSPLSLTAQVVSSTRVDLSWTDGSFNETGFRIEQREAPNGTWFQVGTAGEDATSHSDDDDVEPSKTYDYRVVALTANPNFSSYPSNEVRVTTPAPPGSQPPPSQPGYLGGGASPGLINLGWIDNSSDEDGFRIERSTAGGPFSEIGSVGAGITWYTDTTVADSTSYTYQVRAWNAGGASNPSPPVTVLSLAPGSAPAAPCCPWGYAYNGNGSVTIYWSDQSNNEDNFVVERNDGWGYFYDVGWAGPNTTNYTDYGLQMGQSYTYRIRAENAWGASYSDEFFYYSPYWWEQ